MSSPTPVTDRLQRLAEHAPSRPGDPDALWSQGRRRQRAQWAGTAAALVVLAVLGAVAVPSALQRTQTHVADSAGSELHLPDVIRQPGEWEPAFRGAPGPLVAVGLGTRGGWWSSRTALWGVSASTGESRFLDLPDVALGSPPAALSADGRRLAYWFTDEDVEVHPGTLEPGGTARLPAAGVAVVDLDSGDIERWDGETSHGLLTEGLAWAGDVLWWSAGLLPIGEDGIRRRTHTWDVRTDQRRVVEKGTAARDLFLSTVGPAPGGFVVDEYRLLDVVQGDHVARTVRLDTEIGGMYGGPALSPDGARVASVLTFEPDPDTKDGDRTPVVVSSADGRTTAFGQVGDVRSTAVLGWRSADEIVIEAPRDDDRMYGASPIDGASVVDVDTGEVTPLVEYRDLQEVGSFSADAWAAEVIEAPDAPWAPDPRFVGLVLLVVGAFVVSLAISLRRRRGHA
jgi:hypothetical protein